MHDGQDMTHIKKSPKKHTHKNILSASQEKKSGSLIHILYVDDHFFVHIRVSDHLQNKGKDTIRK